jgi:hypothetical protein
MFEITLNNVWRGMKYTLMLFVPLFASTTQSAGAKGAVAQFLVPDPDWGIYSLLWHRVFVPARHWPPGYTGWMAGTITLCQSRLRPPVRD